MLGQFLLALLDAPADLGSPKPRWSRSAWRPMRWKG